MLTDPNADRIRRRGCRRCIDALPQHSPVLADVATDHQHERPVAAYVDNRPRRRPSRLGITPATVDNALYDAFGQRIISTIFTQSNQYRVMLEAEPDADARLRRYPERHLPAVVDGDQRPGSALADRDGSTERRRAAAGHAPRPVPGRPPSSFNLAPGAALGAAVKAIEQGEAGHRLAARSFQTAFRARRVAFQASLVERAVADPRRDRHGVHRARRALRELHPSDHDPLDAAVGGRRRAARADAHGHDLDIIGVIGIVLLIGIVKKNAIMMIDFALEAEREEGKAPREAIYQACLLRFRPILMTTLAALFGALPLMLGSGAGSELRRPLGIAIVGGLIVVRSC